MEFYGLLGEKLGHSLSPVIHEKILEHNNLKGAYKLFEIEKDKLGDFEKAIKLLKVRGFNVTIPYKESIMKHLDFISEEAKRIGAVNTVLLKEDKLYGYNTDYFGIHIMLNNKNISVENKTAVVLGTGGASKAMITYLLDNNIKQIYLVSRTPEKLTSNENKIDVIDYEKLKGIKGDMIINCTPVGMYPKVDFSPVDENIIENFDIAVDIVYNPIETKFLKFAKEKNCIVVGGLYMLVGQAIKSQEIFNNINMDHKIIECIYEDLISHKLINQK